MRAETRSGFRTSRIEGLSDGIFAISMTILILSFESILQHPSQIDADQIGRVLYSFLPDLLHYAQSFIILGAFWYQHHRQFHYIHSADMVLIMLNVLGLMLIGLIPVSTVMVSDFGNILPAALVFEVNMLLAGAVFFGHWLYASKAHRLIDRGMDRALVKYYTLRNLVIPGVSLAAIALSFFDPHLSTSLYLLVPVILFAWSGE